MNFQTVRIRLKEKGLDIFTTQEFGSLFNLTTEVAAVKLTRYKNRGYLVSPRRGVYFLSDDPPDKFRIANYLYFPSYVSLETILSKEGIIPEVIYPITSLTTKATRKFSDGETEYTYSKIKKEAFTGYQKEGGAQVALPEKALVDYLYFVSQGKRVLNDRINLSRVERKKVVEYASLFTDRRLDNLVRKVLS